MRIYKKELHECYHRLFQASTPKGDFYDMLEKSPTNHKGEKKIPFMDYELDYTTFQEIVEDCIKEFKIPKSDRDAFSIAIYLGPSPKYKPGSFKKF